MNAMTIKGFMQDSQHQINRLVWGVNKMLREMDVGGTVYIEVNAQMNVQKGECLITYKFRDDKWDNSSSATGKDIDKTFTEFCRRRGWNIENKPLLLTAVVDDDEIDN